MARGQGSQPRQRISQRPRASSNKTSASSQQVPAAWETEKPKKYDLDIEAIPFNSRLSSLLPGYIPTLATLKDFASNLALVAFKTESVPHCYKTIEVGLAFIPRVDCTLSSGDDTPTLERFVQSHSVQTVSFKVNDRYDVRDRPESRSPLAEDTDQRPTEPLRFGYEKFVDIEDLETAIIHQVNRFRRAVPGKRLILVGFSLQKDLERLCLEFPGVSRSFSGWIDLFSLMKAESITPPNANAGLGYPLTSFRYPYKDTGFGMRHQAANDAVRILATLRSLMNPQNVTNLVIRQYQFVGIEIAPSIDRFESKAYRALLHVGGSDLPPAIDSAQKLAFAFQHFQPIGVAADCSNARNRQRHLYPASIHTSRRTCGCLCFKNNKMLQDFISAKNGERYGDVILNVARAPLPWRIQKQISDGKKLRLDRMKRRDEYDPDIDWTDSFRSIFLMDSEAEEEDVASLDEDETHTFLIESEQEEDEETATLEGRTQAAATHCGDSEEGTREECGPSAKTRAVSKQTMPDKKPRMDNLAHHNYLKKKTRESSSEPDYDTHEKRMSRLSDFMRRIRRRMSIRRRGWSI
ncbi:hypothetical protein GGS21DRAFT_358763 [Xylaria nigripes]|nr:hypothetical protein GGS21DRAFT_358763 [Xylaria nigripes]